MLNNASQSDDRKKDAEPSGDAKRDVGRVKVEQARGDTGWHGFGESWNGKQAVFTKQGNELIDDGDKGDEIDEREASLEDEPRIPVARQFVGHSLLWRRRPAVAR